MSNMFNLYAESDKGQTKSMTPSKTSQEIRLNPSKTMGGTKPKGLSIRSNSDMNIPSVYSAKKNTHVKEHDSKLKMTQIDIQGRPISPGKRIEERKQIGQSNKTSKKPLNDVFKKPLLPKKNIKRLPQMEKLAYWHDDQYDFDYRYIDTVEKEFKDLFSKRKENMKPDKQSVLVSDPETLLLSNMEKLIPDRTFDEEHMKYLSPNLLQVSDISDDEIRNDN
ncbi:PREDICTED: uncharacterized protein LOC108774728 [Cyphomyrmex costatus]|uniref:Uncharacterized protein n=1 Tax=Cyphomyrmex costatus TaxID=456900 RepID=A0A195CM99_9HYME|nr:PREDICTED: uncharacterized protein LOC108774728 [Cyphomyrmex costatus]KYN01838.1 hypothetical protein ALC62_07310 [Cyphomyrmex costatus]